MKLLKIAASDCPVCAALAEIDVTIATENDLEFECLDLEDFAQTTGNIRDYVVGYHVEPSDGMIDLPIYVIHDGKNAKASGVIKDEAELNNLLFAWDLYNKSVSSASTTE